MLCVVGAGGATGAPAVGISPASAEADRTHVRISAKALADEVLKFEQNLISEVLAKVNGRVSYAAKRLGTGYQGLAYIIESRHLELLEQRTPVYRARGNSSYVYQF